MRISRLATLIFIPFICVGCSNNRYGEDILFSHSLPEPTQIQQCDCSETKGSSELLSAIVYFGTDLYALNEEAIATLDSLVLAINNRKISRMDIVGHTDSRASNQHNELLSKRRANAVIDFLKGRGIQSDEITLQWHGEKAPVASNLDPHGMALNRRSVVTISLSAS